MLRTILALFLSLYFSAPAIAQSTEAEELERLKNLGLPATIEDRPVVLNATNLEKYQNFLIAPIASLVQQGLFSARLTREPGQNLNPSSLWLQASRENEKNFRLGADGWIQRQPETVGEVTSYTGFPFGTADVIASEPDLKLKGQKILWSLSALPGVDSQLLYGIEMTWFDRNRTTKSATGLYYREYLQGKIIPPPAPVSKEGEPREGEHLLDTKEPSAEQMFLPKFSKALDWRELFQLLQPAVVFGYASVTYRYRELVEDDSWTFSPVLGRSRRVLESNRSDPILGSQLSLNDLFLFSARPHRVKAEVVAEKYLMAPFSLRDQMRLESESDEGEPVADGTVNSASIPTARGFYRNRKGHSVGVLWNAETGLFPGLPGWLPTTIQLSPRKLWVVEISPLDPFSANGTEVLFVDQQTFLPFYKATYDRKGSFLRWSMMAWSMVVGKDERTRLPVPLFVLSVDKTGEHATSIETQYVRRLIADTQLRRKVNLLFDIREHDKRAPKKETPPSEETEVGKEKSEDAPVGDTTEPDVHD